MLVEFDSKLADVCKLFTDKNICAMDIEFMRRKTFKPVVSVIQMAYDNNDSFIIDFTQINELSPFQALLANEQCLKVFHSASQDLEILDCYCGMYPKGFFDTQVAAAFCGIGYFISYASLVEIAMGVTLDKKMQQSNWMTRPLSDEQISYAENEVKYLLGSYHYLIEQLGDRLSWVIEESDRTMAKVAENLSSTASAKQVKGANKLNKRAYTMVNELVKWRENVARSADKPVRWILDDSTLIQIALAMPLDVKGLESLDIFSSKQLKNYAQTINSMAQKVSDLDETKLLKPVRFKILSKTQKQVLKEIKEKIASISADLNIASEMVIKTSDLQNLILKRNYNDSILFDGWRKPLFADSVLSILEPS